MNGIRTLLLLAAGLLLTAYVHAQNIASWEEARAWLEANRQSPLFGEILIRSVSLAPALSELDHLAEEFLPHLRDPEKRGRFLHRTGRVFETANRFERASRLYADAVREDPSLTDALLDHAAVLMELGRTEEAIPLLGRAIESATTREQQRTAAVLRTRAFLLEGETDRALRHARSLTGRVNDVRSLYLLYETAGAASNEELRKWSAGMLLEEFSLSPESALAGLAGEDRAGGERSGVAIVHFPGPTRILGGPGAPVIRPPPVIRPREESADVPEPPARETADRPPLKGVQTGSFRDPENAEYMVRDIEAIGFSAEISAVETESGTFYRVIISVPEGTDAAGAQEIILRLKEAGFEGFLVFAPRPTLR